LGYQDSKTVISPGSSSRLARVVFSGPRAGPAPRRTEIDWIRTLTMHRLFASTFRKPLTLAGVLALSSAAFSQDINIDCGANTLFPAPADTYAAAANAGMWNTVGPSGPATALLDTSGAATFASIAVIGAFGDFGFDSNSTSGDDENLLDDFIDVGPTGATVLVRISGLAAGEYELYTYGWTADDPSGSRTEVDVGIANEAAQTVGGEFTGAHAQGVTYALHTVTLNGFEDLDILAKSDTGFGSVNGIQLRLPPLPEPVADFAGTPLNGFAPLIVDFTDASSGAITNWDWVFGDGSTSTDQNPQNTYTIPGTYSVSLMVTGPGGNNTLVLTDYIVVDDPGPFSYCDVNANSVSVDGAILTSTGGYGTSNATFDLINMPNQPGLLYSGDGMPDLPFGCGRRCVGGTTVRGSIFVSVDNQALGLGFDMSGATTINIQAWYRDPLNLTACGDSYNLSNALMP
jgi:PKD repeat protein